MGMQVIKRDGSTVSFDRHKIVVAIQKANKAVEEGERLPESDIDTIASFVEGKKRKRFLVEDIQDMVEKQIMNRGRYELAKPTLFIATTGPLSVKPIRRMNPSCL